MQGLPQQPTHRLQPLLTDVCPLFSSNPGSRSVLASVRGWGGEWWGPLF